MQIQYSAEYALHKLANLKSEFVFTRQAELDAEFAEDVEDTDKMLNELDSHEDNDSSRKQTEGATITETKPL